MMAVDSPAENLDAAIRKARREFRDMDPFWMASRSGTTYDYSRRHFVIPFFGQMYHVFFPEGEVTVEGGGRVDGRALLIMLHYLMKADGTEVAEEWVAYRDLPGARYHEPAFTAEVERPLSLGLAGKLEELRAWAETRARIVDLAGDLAFIWLALPRVPLLVIFNEEDEEFPASARLLFESSAPNYLPTEDLSVLAETAAHILVRALS